MKKFLAVSIFVLTMSFTCAAFAGVKVSVTLDDGKFCTPITTTNQNTPPEPKNINGQRPPEPPKDGKRPPKMSGDRKPPEPRNINGQRPPEPPQADDDGTLRPKPQN